MPVLRLLAESASALGSAGTRDLDGRPRFPVAAGDTVQVALDCTGWLGADTLSASAWDADLTLSGEASSAGIATALAAVPASAVVIGDALDATAYEITHTATASSGRVRVTTLYLVA